MHKIHRHPFNQGLKNGSLSKKIFHAFLIQDRIYLKKLAETQRIIAARFPEQRQLFLEFSESALDEIKTVDYYLQANQNSRFFHNNSANKTLPVIDAYTDHLITHGKNAPLEVAIACLLPCFLIYSQLGQAMQKEPLPNNPFQKWIDSYADDNFLMAANKLKTIAENAARNSPHIEAMIQVFTISSDFEIAFWDAVLPRKTQTAEMLPSRGEKVMPDF